MLAATTLWPMLPRRGDLNEHTTSFASPRRGDAHHTVVIPKKINLIA